MKRRTGARAIAARLTRGAGPANFGVRIETSRRVPGILAPLVDEHDLPADVKDLFLAGAKAVRRATMASCCEAIWNAQSS